MANEPTTIIVGNLTADPELRFTPSGSAVANFTVASTPRTLDRQSNEWKDGETLFMRCSIWRDYAENVAETLTKGMQVMVSGRLKSRTYDTKEGQKVTVMEMEVEDMGPTLRFARGRMERVQRNGGQGAPQGVQGGGYNGGQGGGGYAPPGPGGAAGGQQYAAAAAGAPGPGGWGGAPGGQAQPSGAPGGPAGDPWATPGQGGGQQWGNGPAQSNEPPF